MFSFFDRRTLALALHVRPLRCTYTYCLTTSTIPNRDGFCGSFKGKVGGERVEEGWVRAWGEGGWKSKGNYDFFLVLANKTLNA